VQFWEHPPQQIVRIKKFRWTFCTGIGITIEGRSNLDW
jgi:hypothetical protein